MVDGVESLGAVTPMVQKPVDKNLETGMETLNPEP